MRPVYLALAVGIALALPATLAGCPSAGGYEAPPLNAGIVYRFSGSGGTAVGTVESYGPGSWVQIRERQGYGGEIGWVNLEQISDIADMTGY